MRRYAEGTRVSVDQTQGEIRALLRSSGAAHFALAESPMRQAIEFALAGVRYRFAVEVPGWAWGEANVGRRSPGSSLTETTQRVIDAEWRRRWRARMLWLKATLEFADGETEDELVNVLGAFAVLENGQTLGQALANGSVPLLGSGR